VSRKRGGLESNHPDPKESSRVRGSSVVDKPSGRTYNGCVILRRLVQQGRLVKFTLTANFWRLLTHLFPPTSKSRSPDDKMYEFACHEGNYEVLKGVLDAARTDEK
jgi:hypothetical protein